jgi:hypothetical protein
MFQQIEQAVWSNKGKEMGSSLDFVSSYTTYRCKIQLHKTYSLRIPTSENLEELSN